MVLYKTMKAIVKEKDGVFLRDISVPTIGPKDVLIKVAIVAYCRTDGYVARDEIKTKTPLTLGHEFSGMIEKTGSDVTKFQIGDRVAIMPILPDQDGRYLGPMLGMDLDGAFAEYVSVPEIAVYHIPDTMSFIDAAYLEPVAASLAVLNVPLQKEARGFIVGKNRIANLTKRIFESDGFQHIDILSLDEIKNLPDDSYDFAVETIAKTPVMSELVRLIKPGGTIVLKSRQYAPVEINVKDIVKKDLKLIGTQYGDFQKGMDLINQGQLKVDDFFEALDFDQAINYFQHEESLSEERKPFFNTHLCAE